VNYDGTTVGNTSPIIRKHKGPLMF